MNEWETIQPSKHLVLTGGYSHQGPWLEGNTFLSYSNPKALFECWRHFFSNEIIKVTKELWRNYHFVGNTGRILVFSNRPYYESIPRLPWVTSCEPRKFMVPRTSPIFEPLIYCGLCEQYTTFHEHPCNNDPLWESTEGDEDYSFDCYSPNYLLLLISVFSPKICCRCRMLVRCIAMMMSRLFGSNSTSSLASRSSSLPEIPKENGIINSEEYELSDVDLKLGEWNLPKIPRTLKWSEVSFPDNWKLENENYPLQIQNPDQDSELDFVQQLADGSVRLSFDKSRFRSPLDDYRPRSPIDLHRFPSPSKQPLIPLGDRPASQASSSRPLAPYLRSKRDLGPEFQGAKTRS
ncbi:hypothetical protein SO802_026440 [Lithocarpus litseifolius]|uniref:Uncharacterized protein n=1 Tax=Lithocarpus litseifolius TaxID=425828 RepID=A0AAW2C4Y7_9ROSI